MKFYLRKIRLNSGGYDNIGGYWGIDKPLYSYTDVEYNVSNHLRAWNRDEAKELVRKEYPNATFFN